MKYGKHAIERMQERGIRRSDADAVVANPIKIAPGQNGATNYWGFDSNGKNGSMGGSAQAVGA
jgi:hypothetical protein